jgi:polysaccharide export outer membrane protein
VSILPDGTISFPLAGELTAQGKTVSDVQLSLTEKLSSFLADPVVTVSVVSVAGNSIHVIGQVQSPGSFVMAQPLSVMQALSLSGGLTPFAKENNIIILRQNGLDQEVISVSYSSIEKGSDLSSNVRLKSGDVIVVP